MFASLANICWRGAPRRVFDKINADQTPGRAAQMAFYFFLSMFPMLLILLTVTGMFMDATSVVRSVILERLSSVAPAAIVRVFTRLLDHLAGQPGPSLSWGFLLAIWASSSGMVAAIRGLNDAYAVVEERPWWRRRLIGLALTMVMLFLLAAAMLLLSYGVPLAEELARHLGLGAAFLVTWQIAQWPVIFGFVMLAFDLLYHFGPHRPPGPWRWLRVGTLLAIALWLAASLGLKFFVANIASYNVAYGSLGAVIVLLLWFYLTALAFLMGAQVNMQLEPSSRTGAAAANAAP